MESRGEPSGRKPSAIGPFLWCVALGVVLGAVCALLCRPGWPLHSLELKTLDARFRYRDPLPAPTDVVIIGIDEQSIRDSRLGRWEWDRAWHARLIEKLAPQQPKVIAFDVLFSEASRGGASDDAQLAAATGQAGCVLHASYASDQVTGKPEQAAAARFAVEPRIVVHQEAIPRVTGIVPPLASLAQAAAGSGVIAARPDPDGVLRRAFFLVRDGKTKALFPTFELAAAARAMGWDIGRMRFDLAQSAEFQPGRPVPLDGHGNALTNYLGPAGTVTQYSFADVIDGHCAVDAFRGKVVLVGFTAPGLHDYFPVPFPGGMFGVEIHAQVLANLLHGSFLRQSDPSTALGLAILLAIFGAVTARLLRPVVGLVLLALALVVYDLLAMQAFTGSRTVWPLLAPNLAAVLAYMPIAVIRLTSEEAARRRLRGEFGRYAPPQMVARLDAGELRERSAGTLRTITALFADVRGFTAWSAEADPRAVVSVLNTYFESMTQLAFDLDGTVDNIVGDEIFITFNALDDQSDHMARAANLALNMIQALDGLNERWAAGRTLPEPLRIGIGINAGEALVGNLGSHVRTQYTVLGQTVNLASRLQSLNKELGTTILVTRPIAEAVAGQIETRNRGMQNIRGHPEPVEVFELLGRVGPGSGGEDESPANTAGEG